LKQALISAPILSYPKDEGQFILYTDASLEGIGAVLSQEQDGEEKVLGYTSKKLSKTQRNYCTTMREMLACVAFLKHFKQYLLGRKIVIRTDHASLTWVTNFRETDGTVARWMVVLA